jgi:heptosyltransferase-3
VICTRRIGDVLLATSLVRSLKATLPDAAVDMLVFEGTQDILSANSDLRNVVTISERPGMWEQVALLRRLWRRYDLSMSVLAGDRPTFYAWTSGRFRIGTLLPDRKSRWKRSLLDAWVPFDNLETHTVAMNLRLLEPLGIPSVAAPVVSWRPDDEATARRAFPGMDESGRYVLLHVTPKYPYKSWTALGWVELARWLTDQGLTIVVAGGASPEECAFVTRLLEGFPPTTIDVAGKVGLPALGYLLSRATLYVGTDTAVTHMAAALGVPTVALFGPSNPVKWGPWPKGFPASSRSPWRMHGSQRQANVFLLQGEAHCVPCLQEGCERHVKSLSDCLQHLPASRVIAAAETMLCK